MKKVFLFFLFTVSACTHYEKPWVISYKQKQQSVGGWYYQYHTSNGHWSDFYDMREYFIGDTIK